MKKFVIFIMFFIFCAANSVSVSAETVSNKYFSVTIPEDLNGTYEVQTVKDKISFFHKE